MMNDPIISLEINLSYMSHKFLYDCYHVYENIKKNDRELENSATTYSCFIQKINSYFKNYGIFIFSYYGSKTGILSVNIYRYHSSYCFTYETPLSENTCANKSKIIINVLRLLHDYYRMPSLDKYLDYPSKIKIILPPLEKCK